MHPTKTVVVVATDPRSSSEDLPRFLEAWREQFEQHAVELVVVHDGETPTVRHGETTLGVSDVMRADGSNFSDLVFNRNYGVRNLGFAFVARFLPSVEVIVTLDENALPAGDTIGDHLQTLQRRTSLSWMTTSSHDLHGVPDSVQNEAPVMVSHGIGRLVGKDETFYNGTIPRGVYAPIHGTNLAFRRKVLEHLYFAPMGPRVGMDGFADIWMGIFLKRALDGANSAIYSGGAAVYCEPDRSIGTHLPKQEHAWCLNEALWRGEESASYCRLYAEKRERWADFCSHARPDTAKIEESDVKYGPGASLITDSGVQLPGQVRPHLMEGHEKGESLDGWRE